VQLTFLMASMVISRLMSKVYVISCLFEVGFLRARYLFGVGGVLELF
jgi:hypothetical protein